MPTATTLKKNEHQKVEPRTEVQEYELYFMRQKLKTYQERVSFDVISHALLLQQYATQETEALHSPQSFAHEPLHYKQFITNAKQELESIIKLNQPRMSIPERLNKFPFKSFRFFFQLFIKFYNYVHGPQRTINTHLQTLAANNLHILQQLFLEQRNQIEIRQGIASLKQQLNQLSEKIVQMEQENFNSTSFDDKNN